MHEAKDGGTHDGKYDGKHDGKYDGKYGEECGAIKGPPHPVSRAGHVGLPTPGPEAVPVSGPRFTAASASRAGTCADADVRRGGSCSRGIRTSE